MCTRSSSGTLPRFVAPSKAAALLASAGLFVAPTAAFATNNNPQNGPAPAAIPNGPDLNGSGYVDFTDLVMMLAVMNTPTTANPAWVAAADLNADGLVDFADLSILLTSYGQLIPPPPPVVEPPAPPPPPPEEPPAPEQPPAPPPSAPVLSIGSGFFGPLVVPSVVGDPTGPGADAKAIARWNAVPGQFISGQFNVGVVAFHMNGINRVEFIANGGPVTTVNGSSINPETGNREYWVTINTNDLPDGPIELRAIAYPNTGIPRVLQGDFDVSAARNGEHALQLNVRHGNAPAVYVTNLPGAGSDSNPGTRQAPFATIGKAIISVPDGGDVVLLNPGNYMSPQNIYGHLARNHQHWITIRPDEGISRDEVIITDVTRRTMRANASRLRWQGITIDFAMVAQIYSTGQHMNWIDGCAMIDSEGWTIEDRPISIRNPWFATDALAENKLYAYSAATLVRNSVAQQISGDAFQNTGMVIGCEVNDLNGSLLAHHTDLIQVFGETDNMIVTDLEARGLQSVQSFFLEPTFEGTPDVSLRWLRNAAFVDIKIDIAPVYRWSANAGAMVNMGGAPWSQLLSRFDHVLFDNVEIPNQQIMLRHTVEGLQSFAAHNVVFREVGLHPMSYTNYLGASGYTPPGVQFVNCYVHPDAAE